MNRFSSKGFNLNPKINLIINNKYKIYIVILQYNNKTNGFNKNGIFYHSTK